jgi:hypothetical protein
LCISKLDMVRPSSASHRRPPCREAANFAHCAGHGLEEFTQAEQLAQCRDTTAPPCSARRGGKGGSNDNWRRSPCTLGSVSAQRGGHRRGRAQSRSRGLSRSERDYDTARTRRSDQPGREGLVAQYPARGARKPRRFSLGYAPMRRPKRLPIGAHVELPRRSLQGSQLVRAVCARRGGQVSASSPELECLGSLSNTRCAKLSTLDLARHLFRLNSRRIAGSCASETVSLYGNCRVGRRNFTTSRPQNRA